MKIIDCEQGSLDWYVARLGIPTASNFHKIVTPAKGDLSKTARTYAYQLVTERLLNQPVETVEGQRWMERGQDLEPMAVKQYEFAEEVETVPVGFITTDDGFVGASPDRLIKGKARGLEIKCPAPHTHIGYLMRANGFDPFTETVGADQAVINYKPQVQGQLWVAELDRADLYSYHPQMPPALIQTGRDDLYIDKLVAALEQFNANLFAMVERASRLGIFQAAQRVLTPIEREEAGELGEALREESGVLWGP